MIFSGCTSPFYAPLSAGQSGAHTATYGYRFGDKLKWSTTNFPDEQPKSYNYDGFGRRRNAMVTGTPPVTWWRYDAGWNMIAEYTDPNADWLIENQTSTHVPGLAEIMGADPATGTYRYYYGDNLGSNRRMRNQSKASLANYEYDPYGSLYNGAGLPLKRGFTGHTWDNDTKMYFAPYRYYMPGAARWLTRDPIGYAGGLNLYGYVGGNPVNFFDELGLTDNSINACARNNPKQFMDTINPADVDDKLFKLLREGVKRQMKGHKNAVKKHMIRKDKYIKEGNWKGVRDMYNHARNIVRTSEKLKNQFDDFANKWLRCNGR